MSVFDLPVFGDLPSRTRDCFKAISVDGFEDYGQLAAYLVHSWVELSKSKIGICGGQGAGKSTLSRLIKKAGAFYGEHVEILEIDDFYLTKAERMCLAETIHPALGTRGPPGTHDIDRILDVLNRLEKR